MSDMIPVLILIVIFYFVWAIVRTASENRIRTQLIEKGLVDEKVKHLFAKRLPGDALSSLKWGIVLTGIGLALFIAFAIHKYVTSQFQDEITLGGMFLFAGLGLIIYYFLARKMEKSEPKD